MPPCKAISPASPPTLGIVPGSQPKSMPRRVVNKGNSHAELTRQEFEQMLVNAAHRRAKAAHFR